MRQGTLNPIAAGRREARTPVRHHLLLTGPIEGAALTAALSGHNPAFNLLVIERAEQQAALRGDVLRRSRMIAFVSRTIKPHAVGFRAVVPSAASTPSAAT